MVPAGLLAFGRWQREGERGRAWVRALPDVVSELLGRWELEPDGEAGHGYNGLALPVLRRGGEAGRTRDRCVLKVSWPDESAAGNEALALATWNGCGAVRLLAASQQEGALLLERADSSRPLSSVPLAVAIPAAGRLLRRLAVPAPPGPRELTEIAAENRGNVRARWEALGRPFAQRYVELAEELADELSRRTGNRAGNSADTLLVNHDLHYDNVLAAEREPWLAIDPKVYVGDPEYQVAQLLWTRLDEMEDRSELLGHFETLADVADLDREVARAWIVVRCVDYRLWGLAAGFTDDPRRCAALVEAFASTPR